ncbi:unnamed protein product [Symbiodinium necroappetens]|uniref:SAP domain-containing protein n=1 Tax=Symbiodinium necroappetens TaxID=1628268 RepID=A0A812Z8F2_9DINO|nr:unnamed protein product [Symbiodinium necroappetens]
MELPVVEEMRQMSIRDLRKLCVKHSLTVRGSKEQVILRLDGFRLGSQVPKPPPTPPAASYEQRAREQIACSNDFRYTIYPRDAQDKRVSKQTQFYVPAVTREEIEDDNTSDSEGISCDDSMDCEEEEEEGMEDDGSVTENASDSSVLEAESIHAEHASDSSVLEAESIHAEQEAEEQSPFAEIGIVEDRACRSAEKTANEDASEPDDLLPRMSEELDRCPC